MLLVHYTTFHWTIIITFILSIVIRVVYPSRLFPIMLDLLPYSLPIFCIFPCLLQIPGFCRLSFHADWRFSSQQCLSNNRLSIFIFFQFLTALKICSQYSQTLFKWMEGWTPEYGPLVWLCWKQYCFFHILNNIHFDFIWFWFHWQLVKLIHYD